MKFCGKFEKIHFFSALTKQADTHNHARNTLADIMLVLSLRRKKVKNISLFSSPLQDLYVTSTTVRGAGVSPSCVRVKVLLHSGQSEDHVEKNEPFTLAITPADEQPHVLPL